MSAEPTPYILALADERRMCVQSESGQDERLASISEELAANGWSVNDSGELVPAAAVPASKRTAAQK